MIQHLPSGRGWAWYGEAFTIFRRGPLAWILLFLVYLVINIVISLVPLVGTLAGSVMDDVFLGGIMLGCAAADRGEKVQVESLFDGFKRSPRELFLLGIISLLLTGIIMGISFGAFFVFSPEGGLELAERFASGKPFTGDFFLQHAVGALMSGLVFAALLVPLLMATWFAPALIALQGMNSVEALKASFRGCVANVGPFLVYSLAGLLFWFLAALPFGIGLFVMFPVHFATIYVGYREIYLAKPELSGGPAGGVAGGAEVGDPARLPLS